MIANCFSSVLLLCSVGKDVRRAQASIVGISLFLYGALEPRFYCAMLLLCSRSLMLRILNSHIFNGGQASGINYGYCSQRAAGRLYKQRIGHQEGSSGGGRHVVASNIQHISQVVIPYMHRKKDAVMLHVPSFTHPLPTSCRRQLCFILC